MPIYNYKAEKDGCQYCQDGFEQLQSMSDKPLKKCPECKATIRKVPSLCSGFTPMLSNGSLRDKGFTKLQKRSDGSYEKVT